MIVVMALSLAVVALVVSGAGVWALVAWYRCRRSLDALSEQLYVDSRLGFLTTQALAAMRDAARTGGDRP